MKRLKRLRQMRQVIAIVALIGSAGALINAATAADSQGSSFRFKLKGDRFAAEVTQRFDGRKSLDDIRAVLSDNQLLPEISNLVTKVKVQDVGGGSYLLETTVTKSIDAGVKIEKSATTVNRCTEKSGPRSWERQCAIVLDRGDTAKFLLEGKNSTYCEEGSGRDRSVTCVSRTEARPKPIRYWPVFVRSPQQLAASAARETLHDLGVLFLVANTKLPTGRAKAQFDESALDKLSLRLYQDVRGMADRNEIGTSSILVEASDQTGAYELRIQ